MLIKSACKLMVGIKFIQLLILREFTSTAHANFHSTSSCISRSLRDIGVRRSSTNHTVMHDGKNIMEEFRRIIPPLTHSLHKGQAGRIGVIGGSEEYTGAPYFAAITILKVGADLSHVFCPNDASPVIKSYSPELIVHPLLDQVNGLELIKRWLPRLHAVVIGPGLGHVPSIFDVVKDIITDLRSKNIPIVIDADGLILVTQVPSLIEGYKRVILTPNLVEFNRLYSSLNLKLEDAKLEGLDKSIAETVAVSKAMGDITIVRKGAVDVIASGDEVVTVDERGSPRRCGGQGDLLCGAMAVFSHWAHHSNVHSTTNPGILAGYAACVLTKRCATEAFIKHQRSTTTTDLIAEISSVFQKTFENDSSGHCSL